MNAQLRTTSPVLLDTGFLIALYDQTDSLHQSARAWLRSFRGNFVCTDQVITETCFFLPTEDKALLLEQLSGGYIDLVSLDAQAYRRVATILRKYADLKPDLTDACLVWLAEKTGIHAIVTVDVNDFSTYRIGGRAKFDLLPWQAAS